MLAVAAALLLAAAPGADAVLPDAVDATSRGIAVTSTGPGMLAGLRRSLLGNSNVVEYLRYHMSLFEEADGDEEEEESPTPRSFGVEMDELAPKQASKKRAPKRAPMPVPMPAPLPADDTDEETADAPAPAEDTDDETADAPVEDEEEDTDEDETADAPGPVEDTDEDEIAPAPVEDTDEDEIAPAPVEDTDEDEIAPAPVEDTDEDETAPASVEDTDEETAPAPVEDTDEEETAPAPAEETPDPVQAPPNTDGSCTPPSDLPGVQNALNFCKFAAPTPDTQTEELVNFCNEYFFAQDGYMHFTTTDERSELRCPENDDQSDGFIVQEARASFEATVRLPASEIGEEDNYTWMQLHGDSTSWIRFAHYGRKNLEGVDEDAFNYLWMFIKTGSSSSNEFISIPMGPVPTGDFQAGIVLPGDGTVTCYAADFSQTFDIDWSDIINYFKAGTYVQDGDPSSFPVEYKELTFTLDSGQNML